MPQHPRWSEPLFLAVVPPRLDLVSSLEAGVSRALMEDRVRGIASSWMARRGSQASSLAVLGRRIRFIGLEFYSIRSGLIQESKRQASIQKVPCDVCNHTIEVGREVEDGTALRKLKLAGRESTAGGD